MRLLAPFHQDDLLPTLAEELPPDWADAVITADLPAGAEGWERLAPIYAAVADGVAGAQVSPTVVSGCCCVSLGTLAGLQRIGIDPAVVWIDAHGDVQTMETSASGYLGGMPLRLMAGYRPDLVADQIGLRPIPGTDSSSSTRVTSTSPRPPTWRPRRSAAPASPSSTRAPSPTARSCFTSTST